jgi:hypothetical protein
MNHRLSILTIALLVMMISLGPAWAPGSITFEEVMGFARQDKNLIKEIQEALKKEKVSSNKVLCGAERYGNHWTYLGGGRALPFTCDIGKQELVIDGDTDFLDKNGKLIPGGLDNDDVFKNAHDIREKNPTWEWNPK